MLAHKINPAQTTFGDLLQAASRQSSESAAAVLQTIQLARRERDVRRLKSRNTPSDFIAWFEGLGEAFPEQMRDLVHAYHARQPPTQTADGTPKATESTVAPAEPAGEASANRPLGTRERNTLLKLVLAAAWDGYGYRPSARTTAVADIVSATERMGHPVSKQTINNYLKEALDQFDLPADD